MMLLLFAFRIVYVSLGDSLKRQDVDGCVRIEKLSGSCMGHFEIRVAAIAKNLPQNCRKPAPKSANSY